MHEDCPNPRPDCKYYPNCFADVDHIYYPKSEYKKGTERTFRELPINKRLLCRALHELRHATETPPPKPSLNTMIEAIRNYKNGKK